MVEAERLIEEVEARPGLFDKSLPEYANKKMKDALWMDVTKTLVDEWEDMSEVERNVQSKEIQLKWKHIRDNFRRELQAQKKLTPNAKKKRKYKYFDQMVFLIPYVNDGISAGNGNPTETVDLDLKQDNLSLIEVQIDSPPTTNRPPPRNTYTRTKVTTNSFVPTIIKTSRKKKMATTIEEEILRALKSKDSLDTDEDRAFCLSLVSSMKKMSDATKLNAKIDILKIIRQYTVLEPDSSPTHTVHDPVHDTVSTVPPVETA